MRASPTPIARPNIAMAHRINDMHTCKPISMKRTADANTTSMPYTTENIFHASFFFLYSTSQNSSGRHPKTRKPAVRIRSLRAAPQSSSRHTKRHRGCPRKRHGWRVRPARNGVAQRRASAQFRTGGKGCSGSVTSTDAQTCQRSMRIQTHTRLLENGCWALRPFAFYYRDCFLTYNFQSQDLKA